MTQASHPNGPDGTYLFTLGLKDRSSTLLVDRAGLLRTVIAEVQQERPFAIDTVVILPDRIHAIWTLPEGDTDYLTRWAAIKSRFERALAGSSQVPDTIWQQRVKAFAIRSPADLERHRKTCLAGPVDAGLFDRPSRWPHASFHGPRATRHAA